MFLISGIKIAVIGAGSTYTPELVEGIINRYDSLQAKEIAFMDIDDRKLQIVGGLCIRMLQSRNINCNAYLTSDIEKALAGADFVLVQIRVGKLPARVLDEKIPLKHGLIGQETTGIGGFFKALRTIPVLMDIAKKMETLCPGAFMINFSNPSGIAAQALLNNTDIKMIGLCNVPINMYASVRERLCLSGSDYIEYYGLNHLSYITSVIKDGKDILKTALDNDDDALIEKFPIGSFDTSCIKAVRAIPSSYLEYFYHKDEKLRNLSNSKQTRGEICMEVEEDLLKLYSDCGLDSKPELLGKRGGARYSEAAISLVDAIQNDKKEIHVVNTLNKGAIPFMRHNDVVEIACSIDKNGARPINAKVTDNLHIINLMRQIKEYELRTVNAALEGDDNEAIKAFLSNPLILDAKAAKACYEDMKQAHAQYLPQFRTQAVKQ